MHEAVEQVKGDIGDHMELETTKCVTKNLSNQTNTNIQKPNGARDGERSKGGRWKSKAQGVEGMANELPSGILANSFNN